MRVLKRHAAESSYLETLLEEELAATSISSADRRLAQELAFGVVRWQATLDWLIARKTRGRAQKVTLQILLRLGLYQMFWLDRIPNHAAVHETVEMAKQLGFGQQSGFVNAVLRAYVREREAARKKLADLKTLQPGLGYSHPDWLCERWNKRWGEEKLRRLLEWNNNPPVTYARLNSLRTDPDRLSAQWEKEGVKCVPRQWDWTGGNLVFELKSHPPLASLPSFQEGLFYIQDPSTLLAVRELAPQPGESVLDFCAAPGGKTTFIAQLMQDHGRIAAHDNSSERLKLLQQNCARLGVTCVELASPSTLNPQPSTHFDRILLDAPCSNTGAMRRRVDLRWRIRPEEIERLRAGQLQLLQKASAQLKAGGTLVYSTCSLEPEENEEVVRRWLAEQSGFRLESERTLLPFAEGVDGGYVARLRN